MWNAAHQFERAAEGLSAARARRAVLRAVGYEYDNNDLPPPVDPPPPRFGLGEQFLHDSFFGIVPFFLWITKACVLAFALLVSSVGTYGAVWGSLMRGQEVHRRPLFFDYSGTSTMPVGVVDLRSERVAPWVLACGEDVDDSHGEMCINNEDEVRYSSGVRKEKENENATHKESAILDSGKKYFFELSLTLPESDMNKQLGVFMVKVDLRSSDGSLLATSRQHSMLPYESDTVSLFRKMMLLLPLSSRIISETRTINLLCFDNYLDSHDKKPMSLVEVSLGLVTPNSSAFPQRSQTIQIHSAELRYGREMKATQLLVRKWSWSCALLGTLLIFMLYALISWRVLNYRARRKRRNTQPYADFFDSNDESVQYSTGPPASRNRWAGVDIEILEDDEDDSSAWEAIPRTRESVNPTEGFESDNLVSDDESCLPKQNLRKKSEHANKASSLSNLADKSRVTGHEPLLATNEGAEHTPDRINEGNHQIDQKSDIQDKEEKILANMVMKGQTKRDLCASGEIAQFL